MKKTANASLPFPRAETTHQRRVSSSSSGGLGYSCSHLGHLRRLIENRANLKPHICLHEDQMGLVGEETPRTLYVNIREHLCAVIYDSQVTAR